MNESVKEGFLEKGLSKQDHENFLEREELGTWQRVWGAVGGMTRTTAQHSNHHIHFGTQAQLRQKGPVQGLQRGTS